MDNIAEICFSLGLVPRRVIEVGAAHPNTQRCSTFIQNGTKVTLIEANPRLHYCLTKGFDYADDFKTTWPNVPPPPYQHKGFDEHANVLVVNAAIVDTAQAGQTVHIYERDSSSFVGGVASPAKTNDGYVENAADRRYDVLGRSIAEFDNGQVDVLLADVEGCEWFCIKNLISRPKVIVLETHGQSYRNPRIMEIAAWMDQNGYTIQGQDQTDTLFIRST